MVKYVVISGLAAGVLFAAPAFAADSGKESTEAAEANSKSREDPDEVRCESRPITGTRARRERVCMTNAEWQKFRDAGNRDARRAEEGFSRGHIPDPATGG
jgi:hypothetical protein